MGRRRNKTKTYEKLSPEELHEHIRKNISIPKYMDAFLYQHNISLSKLAQSAISQRMEEQQKETIKKDIEKDLKQKTIKKHLSKEQKKNPQFTHELQRAKYILINYFNSFDSEDQMVIEKLKNRMLNEFPELYVDVLKFEQWQKENKLQYTAMKKQYENPVERLVRIKKHYL